MLLLRRQPSTVDLALEEERSRCDADSVEKQGLDLLEPRPVLGPIDIPMDLNASLSEQRVDNNNNNDASSDHHQQQQQNCSEKVPPPLSAGQQQQPRFVMGGIAEVMEGRG